MSFSEESKIAVKIEVGLYLHTVFTGRSLKQEILNKYDELNDKCGSVVWSG